MRPTDQDRKVWLIWSGQYHAWWREDSKGYTQDAVSAGRYTASEVIAIKSGSGEEKMLTGMISMPEHDAYAAQLEGEVTSYERLCNLQESKIAQLESFARAKEGECAILESVCNGKDTEIAQLRADKAELVEVLKISEMAIYNMIIELEKYPDAFGTDSDVSPVICTTGKVSVFVV